MQGGAPLRQRRVIWHRQLDAHEAEHRGDEAFGLAQRQVEDGTHHQHGLDRQVGVDRIPASRPLVALQPGGHRLFGDPEGDVAAAPQSVIIGRPVLADVAKALEPRGRLDRHDILSIGSIQDVQIGCEAGPSRLAMHQSRIAAQSAAQTAPVRT
jgi:hypothetical protein